MQAGSETSQDRKTQDSLTVVSHKVKDVALIVVSAEREQSPADLWQNQVLSRLC